MNDIDSSYIRCIWKTVTQIQQQGEIKTMSIFQVEVVPITLEPHPNADTLSKEIQTVPLLGIYPFKLKSLQEMAEGHSLIEGANHIREGVVVRPKDERITNEIGRLQLKLISNTYLDQ